MQGLLPNKVVLVTGASQGIGAECAIAAAKHGANIVLHHLGSSTEEQALVVQHTIQQLGRKCVLVSGDIAIPKTAEGIVASAVNTFGRIDALVSNAGILRVEDFLELSVESWDRVMDVNLRGCFLIVQAVARQMVSQTPSSMTGQRGSIVCISSIAAIRGGSTQSGSHVHYNASKAGVISLMEGSALALGLDGIRCNSILPGTILTDINRAQLADETAQRARADRSALGRLGTPIDVAEPVVWLCSDMSRFVTGTNILVDGGEAIKLA